MTADPTRANMYAAYVAAATPLPLASRSSSFTRSAAILTRADLDYILGPDETSGRPSFARSHSRLESLFGGSTADASSSPANTANQDLPVNRHCPAQGPTDIPVLPDRTCYRRSRSGDLSVRAAPRPPGPHPASDPMQQRRLHGRSVSFQPTSKSLRRHDDVRTTFGSDRIASPVSITESSDNACSEIDTDVHYKGGFLSGVFRRGHVKATTSTSSDHGARTPTRATRKPRILRARAAKHAAREEAEHDRRVPGSPAREKTSTPVAQAAARPKPRGGFGALFNMSSGKLRER